MNSFHADLIPETHSTHTYNARHVLLLLISLLAPPRALSTFRAASILHPDSARPAFPHQFLDFRLLNGDTTPQAPRRGHPLCCSYPHSCYTAHWQLWASRFGRYFHPETPEDTPVRCSRVYCRAEQVLLSLSTTLSTLRVLE